MTVTYNTRNPAVKRLLKEAEELSEPTELYYAKPVEDNLFEWHFTIRGPEDTEFRGGVYHGRILLPSDYPMKPPNIVLLTPNGRFETNRRICLSISGYHPETWRPSWSIRTALLAIIGFMPTHGVGAIGSLDLPKEERQALARRSQNFVCSLCGPTCNLVRPLTDASSSMNKEANEMASKISIVDEFGNSQQVKSEASTSNQKIQDKNDNSDFSKLPTETSESTTSVSSSSSPSTNSPSVQSNNYPVNPPSSSPMNVTPLGPWPNYATANNGMSTTYIAYWLCFPVYYPPFQIPANLQTTIPSVQPVASTSSSGEHAPMSFSDWLKEMRKLMSQSSDLSLSQTSTVHSSISLRLRIRVPKNVVSWKRSTEDKSETKSLPIPEVSKQNIKNNQEIIKSTVSSNTNLSVIHKTELITNHAQTLKSNNGEQNVNLNLTNQSKHEFIKASTCSTSLRENVNKAPDSLDNLDKKINENEVKNDLIGKTITSISENEKNPTEKENSIAIKSDSKLDKDLSDNSYSKTQQTGIKSSSSKTNDNQLNCETVHSVTSSISSRPPSMRSSHILSPYRAANVFAVGVAVALFVIVLRRLALMFQGL